MQEFKHASVVSQHTHHRESQELENYEILLINQLIIFFFKLKGVNLKNYKKK